MESAAELLVKNNKDQVPIGALLLADDIILPQDLDFALDHQKHSKRLLGEILVNIGAVAEQDLKRALELQKNSAA